MTGFYVLVSCVVVCAWLWEISGTLKKILAVLKEIKEREDAT